MEKWVKIQSFNNIYEANLRKQILEQNDIKAVVVNERDSLFLIGDIELYVPEKDEKKAIEIISEFQGLTKVNSFILEEPILELKKIFDNNQIRSEIKKKEDSRYILENYELYVKNEDVSLAIPFLTGEKLTDWALIETCKTVRQTRFRVELLAEKNIKTIIIKEKDSDYHLEKINIYVEKVNREKAKKILEELNGWVKIGEYDTEHRCEIREDLLGQNGIKAYIKPNNRKYELYVEAHNEEKAIDIINTRKEWIKIKTFDSILKAQFAKDLLASNNIEAIIINRRDEMFLIGDIELYVDDFNTEKAREILKQI